MSAFSRRGTLAAAAGLLLAPRIAAAQGTGTQGAASSFPDRPLRIIVPYNAGGITDVMSRAVAQALTPVLGQAVVVENRAGANGTVGTLAPPARRRMARR